MAIITNGHAQTTWFWNLSPQSGTGNWNDPNNWNDGSMSGFPSPSGIDDAVISNGGAVAVTLPGAAADFLSIGNGQLFLSESGTLNANTLRVGNGIFDSSGELIISGGSLTSINAMFGFQMGTNGSATLSNTAMWDTSFLTIGKGGIGSVTVSEKSLIRILSGNLILGEDAGSSGQLRIGGADPGVLNASTVESGNGSAEIVFEHDSTDYYFSDDGTSQGSGITIAGSTTIRHAGTGRTILMGNNDYTGETILENGTLGFANLNGTGGEIRFLGGTFSAVDSFILQRNLQLAGLNSTVDVSAEKELNHVGIIDGNGSLLKTGSGRLVLSGNNTYQEGTTFKEGVIVVSSDANLGNAAGQLFFNGGSLNATASFATNRNTFLFGSGGKLQLNNGITLTHNGTISGIGILRIEGPGTVVLTKDNTYTSGTILTQGATLSVNSSGNLGFGSLSFDNGTLHATGTLTYLQSVTLGSQGGTFDVDLGKTLALNNLINGQGALTKTGGGTLVLGEAINVYSGNTFLNAGILQISADGSLGNTLGTLNFSGGTLQASGSFATTRNTNLGLAGGTFLVDSNQILTHNGIISGVGALSKTGNGTLMLSGTNTYSGGTTITGGTLVAASAQSLGSGAGTLAIDNATFRSAGTFILSQAASIQGIAAIEVDANQTLTYSGAITGNGQLIKSGGGTLELTNNSNTYLSGTTIKEGTLVIANGGSATSSGPVNIDIAGALAGSGVVEGATTVQGLLRPGGNVGGLPKILTFNSDLSFASSGTLEISLLNTGIRGVDYSGINLGSNLFITSGATLNLAYGLGYSPALGDSFQILNFSAGTQVTGEFNFIQNPGAGLVWDTSALYTDGIISVAAIPEPSTWLLLGVAGIITCCIARKNKAIMH